MEDKLTGNYAIGYEFATRPLYYVEDGNGGVRAVANMDEWFASRRGRDWQSDVVARTCFYPKGYIATDFMLIDHSWFGGPPLLYETMAFGLSKVNRRRGEMPYQQRYTTRFAALAGHADWVKQALALGHKIRRNQSLFQPRNRRHKRSKFHNSLSPKCKLNNNI